SLKLAELTDCPFSFVSFDGEKFWANSLGRYPFDTRSLNLSPKVSNPKLAYPLTGYLSFTCAPVWIFPSLSLYSPLIPSTMADEYNIAGSMPNFFAAATAISLELPDPYSGLSL